MPWFESSNKSTFDFISEHNIYSFIFEADSAKNSMQQVFSYKEVLQNSWGKFHFRMSHKTPK